MVRKTQPGLPYFPVADLTANSKQKEGKPVTFTSFPTSDPHHNPVSQAGLIGPVLQTRETGSQSLSNLSIVKQWDTVRAGTETESFLVIQPASFLPASDFYRRGLGGGRRGPRVEGKRGVDVQALGGCSLKLSTAVFLLLLLHGALQAGNRSRCRSPKARVWFTCSCTAGLEFIWGAKNSLSQRTSSLSPSGLLFTISVILNRKIVFLIKKIRVRDGCCYQFKQ